MTKPRLFINGYGVADVAYEERVPTLANGTYTFSGVWSKYYNYSCKMALPINISNKQITINSCVLDGAQTVPTENVFVITNESDNSYFYATTNVETRFTQITFTVADL